MLLVTPGSGFNPLPENPPEDISQRQKPVRFPLESWPVSGETVFVLQPDASTVKVIAKYSNCLLVTLRYLSLLADITDCSGISFSTVIYPVNIQHCAAVFKAAIQYTV